MLRRNIAQVAAENITRNRKMCGFTQAQIAERLSVEKESISRMESGKIALSLERLQQFAEVFGCSVAELVQEQSSDVKAQAQAIAEMLSSLKFEEQKAILRFVEEAVRLFQVKK